MGRWLGTNPSPARFCACVCGFAGFFTCAPCRLYSSRAALDAIGGWPLSRVAILPVKKLAKNPRSVRPCTAWTKWLRPAGGGEGGSNDSRTAVNDVEMADPSARAMRHTPTRPPCTCRWADETNKGTRTRFVSPCVTGRARATRCLGPASRPRTNSRVQQCRRVAVNSISFARLHVRRTPMGVQRTCK